MKAPFPYFGGKSAVAAEVWRRFGNVSNYVEPFFGSGAVLLGRPHWRKGGRRLTETVNDADGLLANFWRAMVHDPEGVASAADWPVNEADLHARHLWLLGQRERITERLMGDPEFYDVKAAGWWVWGACAWIGKGWCSGSAYENSRLPHLGDGGRGINRVATCGASRALPNLRCVADRMRDVRAACGNWTRVLGAALWTERAARRGANWRAAVFLDPPYGEGDTGLYAGAAEQDHASLAADVWAWALDNGSHPSLRIAVCGYEDGRSVPPGWTVHRWKAHGGYGSQGDGVGRANASREVVWFSPHCINDPAQPSLFGGAL